jgi:hypothetical protein
MSIFCGVPCEPCTESARLRSMPGWSCPTISTVFGRSRPATTTFRPRWRLIKTIFARSLAADERRSDARRRHRERGIWQRRFWEHSIRDDADFARPTWITSISIPSNTAMSPTSQTGRIPRSRPAFGAGFILSTGFDRRNKPYPPTQPGNDAIRRVTLRFKPALRGLRSARVISCRLSWLVGTDPIRQRSRRMTPFGGLRFTLNPPYAGWLPSLVLSSPPAPGWR